MFVRLTYNLNNSYNWPSFKLYGAVVASTVSQCPHNEGRLAGCGGLNSNEVCTYSTFMLVLDGVVI